MTNICVIILSDLYSFHNEDRLKGKILLLVHQLDRWQFHKGMVYLYSRIEV